MKMCPLFTPTIFICLICASLWCLCIATGPSWTTQFEPNKTRIQMETISLVNCSINNLDYKEILKSDAALSIRSDDYNIAKVAYTIDKNEITSDGKWYGSFPIEGIFLGRANVYVELNKTNQNISEKSETMLPVVIVRKDRVIDHIFTGSIIILVSLLYINFGAALDISKLKAIVVRPIAPAIGVLTQFVFMPVVSKISNGFQIYFQVLYFLCFIGKFSFGLNNFPG